MQTFLDISDFREIHFSEKKKKSATLKQSGKCQCSFLRLWLYKISIVFIDFQTKQDSAVLDIRFTQKKKQIFY